MQQVEHGSRFWWRALDASSPEPITPNVPPSRPAHWAPNWPWNFAAAPISNSPPYALRIPRGERRHRLRRRRVALAGKASVFFACSGVALLTAAGGIVGSTANVSIDDATQTVSAKVVSSLVMLGFGLDRVSVTGHRQTNDRDIFDALDLPNVATLWHLDMPAVLKRIERISWVDTAQMTRVFPSGLEIAVRERTPAAIWSREGKLLLVDMTGRVLGPADPQLVEAPPSSRLPMVSGEGATADVALLLAAINRHPALRARVVRSERVAERRWRIVLTGGANLELGAEREIEGLDYVASNMTIKRALDGAPMIIDVRTPGRVTMRPVGSLAATAVRPTQAVSSKPAARAATVVSR